MQIIEAFDDFGQNLGGLVQSEDLAVLFGLDVEQVTAVAVFAYKVLEVLVLLCLVQFHDIRRVQ